MNKKQLINSKISFAKENGNALEVIFIISFVLIIAFSIFIYFVSDNFYDALRETAQNNVNMNIEIMQNEYKEQIDNLLERLDELEDEEEANETETEKINTEITNANKTDI